MISLHGTGKSSECVLLSTPTSSSRLKAGGKTRETILTRELELYVPEYFFTELRNNLDAVQRKTALERNQLELLIDLLFEQIRIVPREEFDDELDTANAIIAEVDPDDSPFLALAMHLDAEIWSDDRHFQEQETVATWRTHELLEELD